MVKEKLIQLIIFITICTFGTVSAQELNHEEVAILKAFFTTLTVDSELGYVLYCKKPLCCEGYYVDSLVHCHTHRKDVILKVGAALWKEKYSALDSNIILHLYDDCEKNTLYKNLLIINKDLFIKTVRENLPLFQYAIGPSVTPENLLKELTRNGGSFNAVLKNNKVLIGILLGFGVQNSLYVGRIENLHEELYTYENPPFKPTIETLNELGEETFQTQQSLLLNTSKPSKKSPEVSFPYATLKEEVSSLLNNVEDSSKKLFAENPMFIFGIVKNDPSNAEFIKKLELTQQKIQTLNQADSYLEQVLKLIFPKNSPSIKQQSTNILTTRLSKEQVQDVVARTIWNEINSLNIPEVLEGMKDVNSGKTHRYPQFNHFYYSLLTPLQKGFQNIANADFLFQQLENETLYQTVVPKRIVFKILKEGSNDSLNYNDVAKIAVKIESPDGSILTDTWDAPENVETSKLLPAFAKAIQGMKINEEREIYIHPLVAYGLYTTLEKGIHLKCKVKLLEILKHSEVSSEPTLQELDYSRERNFVEKNHNLHTQEMYDYDIGYKLWSHFKKMDVNWEIVRKKIEGYQQDPSIYKSLTDEESHQLDRLHWNVYQL